MYCDASSGARFAMATNWARTQPFFHKLVASLVREMGAYYTELVSGEARATQVLAQEEIRFAETLATGMALLDAEAAQTDIDGDSRARRCSGCTTLTAFRWI